MEEVKVILLEACVGSYEEAKKAEEKSKAVKENKSGSKAEAKALPNTAAVK